jgi:dephospho-CoA kinase
MNIIAPKTQMILGLTGPLAAGKGETATYLVNKGFISYSLSDVIRDELIKLGRETSRTNMIAKGNEMREKFGPSVLADKTIAALKKLKHKDVVIDSVRNPREVEALKKAGAVMVGIDADPRIRFDRLIKRGRAGDVKTFQELVEVEKKENSAKESHQQLRACYQLADHTLENSKDIEHLHDQIDDLLRQLEWTKK